MSPDQIVSLVAEALMLVIMITCIMVVPSLMVGLVVSVFQAATQINEQTLSFLPRLLTTLSALMIAGPWILTNLMDFANKVIINIPLFIGGILTF